MAAAEENTENACDDGNEKRADKEIGGNREGQASIAHAAEIEDGDDDQNADAEGDRVRQQGRNGRDQGADSRGNAHGGREDIIGEERGRGKQARTCAKVEARHSIGAAAGGIGGDGLAIGEVHDHQQRDDGGADRNDIPNAEKAKGNQKAEGRFRAVSSRAERVETKDRDALRGTDLLGAFVTGLDGLADNEVKYVHERSGPSAVHARKEVTIHRGEALTRIRG